MKTHHHLRTLFTIIGFASFATACGGPAEEYSETESAVMNGNCQELCRRYISMNDFAGRPRRPNELGIFYNPVAEEGARIAEGYLLDAGRSSRPGATCSLGNVAVSSQWNQIQPSFDLYRNYTWSARNRALNQCASDFGL